jgi:ketosteroid isomerase-like protein
MVWPWPSRYDAHDPAEWELVMGRFDAERWRTAYTELFADWELVHNRRDTVTIEISEQGDGGFAVVDIDTLWRRRDSADEMRWNGRVCKVYALVGDGWKMTMHTGALIYPVGLAEAASRWVDVWSRAWPTADVEAIAALYADDAMFYSHPFRKPQAPGEYTRWAFETQAEAECRFGEPVVSDDRAAIEWWGVITSTDGSVETVAGTSLLRFGADGRVVEQRDAWAGEPGRHELPQWATTTS